MSPSRKSDPPRRARGTHATGHHGGATAPWIVTIERGELDARRTVTAPDPDAARVELARHAAADAQEER